MSLFLLRKPESSWFLWPPKDQRYFKMAADQTHYVTASLKLIFHALCILFVCRSHSTAGADQGTVTIQHSFEDPTAAHRDQGCQATSEGDEEGEGVPCHL